MKNVFFTLFLSICSLTFANGINNEQDDLNNAKNQTSVACPEGQVQGSVTISDCGGGSITVTACGGILKEANAKALVKAQAANQVIDC